MNTAMETRTASEKNIEALAKLLEIAYDIDNAPAIEHLENCLTLARAGAKRRETKKGAHESDEQNRV